MSSTGRTVSPRPVSPRSQLKTASVSVPTLNLGSNRGSGRGSARVSPNPSPGRTGVGGTSPSRPRSSALVSPNPSPRGSTSSPSLLGPDPSSRRVMSTPGGVGLGSGRGTGRGKASPRSKSSNVINDSLRGDGPTMTASTGDRSPRTAEEKRLALQKRVEDFKKQRTLEREAAKKASYDPLLDDSDEEEDKKKQKYEIGKLVEAKYLEDKLWYKARVESFKDGKYVVLFTEYGNKQTCEERLIRLLRSSSRVSSPRRNNESSSSVSTSPRSISPRSTERPKSARVASSSSKTEVTQKGALSARGSSRSENSLSKRSSSSKLETAKRSSNAKPETKRNVRSVQRRGETEDGGNITPLTHQKEEEEEEKEKEEEIRPIPIKEIKPIPVKKSTIKATPAKTQVSNVQKKSMFAIDSSYSDDDTTETSITMGPGTYFKSLFVESTDDGLDISPSVPKKKEEKKKNIFDDLMASGSYDTSSLGDSQAAIDFFGLKN